MREVYITIIVVGLILFAPLLLSMGIREIPLNVQPSLEQTQKIYGKTVVSQSVTIPVNNFSVIGTSIKNPNLASKEDLILSVYDRDGQLLRTSTINGKVIQDGNFLKFTFIPIADSRDKSYLLSFSAPTANLGDAFDIFLTNQKNEGMGPLMVSEKQIPGEISLVSFYKPANFLSTASVIFGKWFTNFTGDMVFAGVYLLIISGSALYLVNYYKSRRTIN